MGNNKFYKIMERCKYTEPCECGQNDLCNHPESDDTLCEEDYCPKMKKINPPRKERKK